MNDQNYRQFGHIGGVFLRRRSDQMTLGGYLDGDRVRFEGGKYGPASITYSGPDDNARAFAHWEGYCEASGLGCEVGRFVTIRASGLNRRVSIVSASSPDSKTVRVSGFPYKHGGQAVPRRVKKSDVWF